MAEKCFILNVKHVILQMSKVNLSSYKIYLASGYHVTHAYRPSSFIRSNQITLT